MTLTIQHAPRISRQQFIRVLEAGTSYGPSPAAPMAGRLYDIFVEEGCDPAIGLAFAAHEHQYMTDPGSLTLRYDLKNWGNTRTPAVDGAAREIPIPGRGNFAQYGSYEASVRDWCVRMKGWRYGQAKPPLLTVDDVVPKYAPTSDKTGGGNSPQHYIDHVNRLVARWQAEDVILRGDRMAIPWSVTNDEYLNDTENRHDRPAGTAPIGVTWHGTGGNPANPHGTLRWNLKPQLVKGVWYISSYNDLIDAIDGTVWRYVSIKDKVAWHAGKALWYIDGIQYGGDARRKGYRDPNNWFIGVELDETNKKKPAAAHQKRAAAIRALDFWRVYRIPLAQPWHHHHRDIAPGRKIDCTCTSVPEILDLAHQILWTGDRPLHEAPPYRQDFGIPSFWRMMLRQNVNVGAALADEVNGKQQFEGGVIEWTPAGTHWWAGQRL